MKAFEELMEELEPEKELTGEEEKELEDAFEVMMAELEREKEELKNGKCN